MAKRTKTKAQLEAENRVMLETESFNASVSLSFSEEEVNFIMESLLREQRATEQAISFYAQDSDLYKIFIQRRRKTEVLLRYFALRDRG